MCAQRAACTLEPSDTSPQHMAWQKLNIGRKLLIAVAGLTILGLSNVAARLG